MSLRNSWTFTYTATEIIDHLTTLCDDLRDEITRIDEEIEEINAAEAAKTAEQRLAELELGNGRTVAARMQSANTRRGSTEAKLRKLDRLVRALGREEPSRMFALRLDDLRALGIGGQHEHPSGYGHLLTETWVFKLPVSEVLEQVRECIPAAENAVLEAENDDVTSRSDRPVRVLRTRLRDLYRLRAALEHERQRDRVPVQLSDLEFLDW